MPNDNFELDKNILYKIQEVELSEEECIRIDTFKYNFLKKKKSKYIKDIYIFYKLYKLGCSFREIEKLSNYNYEARGISRIFNEANLSRNKYESQKIGATKRNYGEIRNKIKKTMNEQYISTLGSSIEEYIRNKLDSILYDILPQDYEIIIGKNTMNILKQYENDIPVIIINNNKFYKIAIEFDGSYWHENNKNDEIKEKLLFNMGYTLFRINSKATITSDGEFKYKNDLNYKIQEVADQIKLLIERYKTNNEIL